jgi:FixJ family two-component response regulator
MISPDALIQVVDDDSSMRTALLRAVRSAGLEARGYASSGDLLLNPLPDRPGCLILDVHLPGPSGLDLHEALQRRGVALPVVFLTGFADVAASVRAMKAGAVDFLTKPVKRDVLLDAVARALATDAQRRTARIELQRLDAMFASLTGRERAVFDRVVAGSLNKQIAAELGVAERTVKLDRAQVMAKLGALSASDLGRLAQQLHTRSRS